MFTDFASFRDIGFGNARGTAEENEAPAPPVDPSAIIRSLEDTPELATIGSGATANMSISGILRVLFEAERSEDINATDDEDLDEGQVTDARSTASSKESPKDEVRKHELVNAKLQARLASQMDGFLANLSKPEFAEKCSATQMIQAVCFPLAVALRGRRHGWVSDDSAEIWARRVVAVLFRGKTISSPGLLRAVERRYRERGMASIFREIAGDGTLWVVLIATLGNSEWHGAGNMIEKAIALREVFKDSSLIASAQSPRLAALLGQLRIDGARRYLSVVAPSVSKRLDRIEKELEPIWRREAARQVEQQIEHQIGDVLWRANVGWAVCLAEASGSSSISVQRGSEQVRIGAGFFVNVTELAARNGRLSELLAILQNATRISAAS